MPPLRRLTKKAAYAIAFCTVIASFMLLLLTPALTRLLRRPVLPPPPPESIIVESVDLVLHEQTFDAVARVRNPNPRHGIQQYTVIFVLYDGQGEVIERVPVATYLLPGSVRYVAVVDQQRPPALARVRVETPAAPQFVSVPDDELIPSFNSFLRARRLKTIGDAAVEEQEGIVANRSRVGYQHVDVTGVALSRTSAVVGVSTSFVGELQVSEQREFTLQWPEPTVPTERVIVIPTANIFDPDNILSVRGDPARLHD